ncbi:MAG: acyl-ACP thioesterase domain-containing protein [bacterium]
MEKIGLYQYYFRPGQFDFKNRISFVNLINSVLDAAGKHAESNKFGIEDLMENGRTWMLGRISFEFLANQPSTNNLWIETWVDDIQDVFTKRRFNVYDDNKNLFASACTMWAMIDIKSRRFVPLKKHLNLDFIVSDKEKHTGNPEKIPEISDNIQKIRTLEAFYSDIDINKHVTSSRYIQMMLDAFSLEHHQNFNIKKFEINFLSEVLYGDKLEVKMEMMSENEYIIELVKLKDLKVACRSRILWIL